MLSWFQRWWLAYLHSDRRQGSDNVIYRREASQRHTLLQRSRLHGRTLRTFGVLVVFFSVCVCSGKCTFFSYVSSKKVGNVLTPIWSLVSCLWLFTCPFFPAFSFISLLPSMHHVLASSWRIMVYCNPSIFQYGDIQESCRYGHLNFEYPTDLPRSTHKRRNMSMLTS